MNVARVTSSDGGGLYLYLVVDMNGGGQIDWHRECWRRAAASYCGSASLFLSVCMVKLRFPKFFYSKQLGFRFPKVFFKIARVPNFFK